MAETYSVEAVLTAVDKGMSSTLNGLQKAINGLQKSSNAFDKIQKRAVRCLNRCLVLNLLAQQLKSAFGSIKSTMGEMVGELNSSKKGLGYV